MIHDNLYLVLSGDAAGHVVFAETAEQLGVDCVALPEAVRIVRKHNEEQAREEQVPR